MAVKIRLKRIGRKNRPFYRICVMDARTRRDGQPIEELGSYDPRGESFEKKVILDKPRAHHWLQVGAQPSETVASILRKAGVRKGEPLPAETTVATEDAADSSAE
ncbi:MAG: 30S ribosomal protein S16 [Planctomycetes bacterium]|nr:30S ribosomal protein S16 [Planctomycetota bacterium]